MHTTHRRRLIGALAATLCALTGFAVSNSAVQAAPNGPTMDIQILSFNDFHGNLEPPSGSAGRIVVDHALDTAADPPKAVDVTQNTGGVEYLATHLAEARQGHPYSVTVAAGDVIGASPLLSAAFHDEPTIEAMNLLGLDATAVGNHEFDEGYQELLRMQSGGCIDDGDGANNQNSCPDGSFAGADFPFLAANVKYAGTDDTILPPYTIKNFKGAKIGFIGMTLEDTPSIVTASGVAGLEFADEVETANALVPVLREQGVKAIVVLLHQGGTPAKQLWTDANGKAWSVNPTYDYTCTGGGALDPKASASPIIDIAKNLDPQIDMIVSGHTHQPYVCDIPDPAGQSRLVTSASSFGRLFTETTLKYDRTTQDIVRASVEGTNFPVTRTVAKDPAQTSLLSTYKELVRPIASEIIGQITTDITKTQNSLGESTLGDLIADAQLADDSTVVDGQVPQIAFMNPGGIRVDLVAGASPYGEPFGDVTYEEAFNVQPFNNYVVSMTLTGQDIYDVLTQQFTVPNEGKNILSVSDGFTYQRTATGVVDGSAMLNGTPIDKAASYRVVANHFLADGGDNFPAFKKGTGKYFGGLDIDAFADYLQAHSPYTPGPLTRITQ